MGTLYLRPTGALSIVNTRVTFEAGLETWVRELIFVGRLLDY